MTLTGSGGNATVDTAGYNVTLSGSLSGHGGLIKTDSGTLTWGGQHLQRRHHRPAGHAANGHQQRFAKWRAIGGQ